MRHLSLHALAFLRGYTLSRGNEPLHETRRQGVFHRVYPRSGIARANRSESHALDVSARASGSLRRDAGRAGFGGGVRQVRLRSDGGEIRSGGRRSLPGELAQTALRRLPGRLRLGEALTLTPFNPLAATSPRRSTPSGSLRGSFRRSASGRPRNRRVAAPTRR